MDFRTYIKEEIHQESGQPVDVLTSDVFDLHPVLTDVVKDEHNVITSATVSDFEAINNFDAEAIQRALFATVRQKGADPLDPEEGVEWAQYLLGETSAVTVLTQIQDAVTREGRGVNLTPVVTSKGLDIRLDISSASAVR